MKTRIELQLTFDGPFNVGAGALGGSLADNPLTRDARGLPMVPASAFKGRLRHEVERLTPLLRPDERRPCASPVAETMCQGDETPCPVCQIFGSPWLPGKLIFSDLTLTEPAYLTTSDAPPPVDLRPGVGLSRRRKVAEDGLLYTTEVFSPGAPVTLTGDISGNLNEAELALLKAGLESLFTVGSNKTRGMGWYELNFDAQVETDTLQSPDFSKKESEVGLLLRLESPLLLGADSDEAYYKTTRNYIPGRVIRGALSRLMLESKQGEEIFKDIFDSDTPPVFEHLYATTARNFSFPAPLTARSCKYHSGFKATKRAAEQGHGVGDILIRQTIFDLVLEMKLKGKLQAPLPVLYKPRCPECGANVDHFSGVLVMLQGGHSAGTTRFQYDNALIPVKRSSHTAINRQRAVASDGQLYTQETIEPLDAERRRTIFRGAVHGAPEHIAALTPWLNRVSMIGRGQSRGLGHIKMDAMPIDKLDNPLPAIETRLEAFNKAFRAEWNFYEQTAGLAPLPEENLYFSLTLLAPTALMWQGLPQTAPPPAMLGFEDGVKLLRGFAEQRTMGGWHTGAGLPRRTQLITMAGSVFVYRSRGVNLKELAQTLKKIEEIGLGSLALRRQGRGRALVCLPFHYQSEVTL